MEPPISFIVEDDVVVGVISVAVMSEKRRPGIWQDMLRALTRASVEANTKSANEFLFEVMVDRLLEEFRCDEEKRAKEKEAEEKK